MLAKLYSGALIGVDALKVEVEVNSGQKGEPRTFIVGLPDAAVKESLDRVSAAISNSQLAVPSTKITVNLAPGDIKKEGSTYDLPIALGILASAGKIKAEKAGEYIIAGELALSGELRPVRGAVSLALLARKEGLKGVILPKESAKEAAFIDKIEVLAANSLREICGFFNGQNELESIKTAEFPHIDEGMLGFDFAEVKGQESAKRAIEIAVAGFHNILMIGSPGSGKSMMAKRIPSIMPKPDKEEFLEILGIYSACKSTKLLENTPNLRPFRAVHHSISDIGLIGGGSIPKPGEISLAHNGVLFLDELPEFKRNVLELLRQPLEDGKICISRAAAKIELKCNFMLVAAMNPCPCGHLGDPNKKCRCTPAQIQRYQSKISGPLADRIDIHIRVNSLSLEDLSSAKEGLSSAQMRNKIEIARQIQKERFKNESFLSAAKNNANMSGAQIKKFCALKPEEADLLAMAMRELNLSARAWNKVLKISRTIADIEESENIQAPHLLEAINYRGLDKA